MNYLLISFDVENAYKASDNVNQVTNFFIKNKITGTLFVAPDLLDSELTAIRQAEESGLEIASHGSFHPYFYEKGWGEKISEYFAEKENTFVRDSFSLFSEKGIDVKGLRTVGFISNNELLSRAGSYFDYFAGKIKSETFAGIDRIDISEVLPKVQFHPAILLYIPVKIVVELLIRHNSDVILYFHSFDLIKKPKNFKIYTSTIKQQIYYNRTGPVLRAKISELIKQLIKKGYQPSTFKEFHKKRSILSKANTSK